MTALVAPGTYRLKVSGGINLYELTATITPFTLLADEFEPNDSFDGATRFTARSIHQGGDVTLGPIAGIFDVPAGTYDLTIHNPSNPDFFGIRTGAARESTRPILRIGKTDAPMDVTLYDESRNEISRHEGVRHLELELPVSTVTFIKISAKTVTRYRFTTGQEYDKRRVPEAYQEELVFSVPVPGDRPNWMGDEINYLAFEVDERAMDPQIIRLAAVEGPALTADILDENREVMFSVAQDQQSRHEVLSIDTHGLAPGTYVVRLSALNQPDDAPQGFAIEGVPRF